MITRKVVTGLFAFLLSSTAGWAASSVEEAARIKATFESYLGNEAGVVTVVPAGEGYDITFDPMVYFNKVKEQGFTADVKPLGYHAESAGNGTWKVESLKPLDITFGNPSNLTVSFKAPDYKMAGIFSEELAGFLEATTTTGKITVLENIVDPTNGVNTKVEATIEKASSVFKAMPNGDGTANISSDMSYGGLRMSTQSASPALGQPLSLTYDIPTVSYSAKAEGMSNRKLLEVLAWFMARPNKDQIIKDQAELKTKLKAALPGFKNINATANMEKMTVTSPVGVVGFDSFGFGVDANGIVKDGKLGESFSFTGLKLPQGITPPWSDGIIPTSMKFGFSISGFDAEAPTAMFIDEMDIAAAQPVPPGSEQKYMAAVAPTNSLQLTIPPSEISSGLYSLSYEGTSTINFAGLPQINAKFRMIGMDKVIAQLQQAAADPMAQQAMATLFAAKGIGKADGDAITWDMTMSPEGKLLVNGTDLSAMMGAIAPPPQQ